MTKYMSIKTMRKEYAPLLKALNVELYQSSLHVESKEAIESLLNVIEGYSAVIKEDLQIQVDLQSEINRLKGIK